MQHNSCNIFDHLTEGILVCDTNGLILSSNLAAQTLLIKKKEELDGKNVNELGPFSLNKQSFSLLHLAPQEEARLTYRETNLSVIRCAEGEGKIVYLLRDESGTKQLEEMKLDFVAMAAHELRTPLTSIKGYLSLVHEHFTHAETEEEVELKNMLSRAMISVEQLSSLIENLLNVTQIERGNLALRQQNEEWGKIVRGCVDLIRDRAGVKNQRVLLQEPKETLFAYVDRLRISEIINNLLSNAITFTPNEGTITVSYRTEQNNIVTSIADTGIGISKEDQQHLFEKFFRVTERLKAGAKGTGLGLYIAKSIVVMHGGHIWVESDEGKGATFFFSIPLEQE
ncbi:MAG TPA: ATP-binding protein [Patescibacteria group bacterium]|nr:ATP-binding protein [Patescibacteria group bacterium]